MYQLAHRNVPAFPNTQTPNSECVANPTHTSRPSATGVGQLQQTSGESTTPSRQETANKEMGFTKEVVLIQRIFENKPEALLTMFS
jgi:hypothetical protein